ncbi:MAG: ABC transporter permease [Candidatus Viridilinea halotolerans]|uniref:ABC transporter permease n=1 Tax=Candidatus Viridilinea halotolerans TaxID=2491704 RepID=A0A426U8K0_9CHLR|nr:MAG: ABC transporter permease [Candidatus Viridilinea halotolerans]
MPPRWNKIRRDLLQHRSRTLLVVLSIAIGVLAFGTIMAASLMLERELRRSFLATNPASAYLTTTLFDDDLLAAVRHVPGVSAAEGRRVVAARIQLGPNTWQETMLHVLPTDGLSSINMVRPWQGAWPPPKRGILIERASLPRTNAVVGDMLFVALAGGTTRPLLLAGLTHDLSLPPAPIVGQAFGHITADTLVWLGGPSGYNQLALVVDEALRHDETAIRAVVERVEHLIQRGGRPILSSEVPPPLQHPAEVVLPTLIAVLTTVGSLALLISTFLIINTISAILTQQTRQIGVMKAIGARNGQLALLYVAMAASFGLLALLLAAPLSMLGANLLGGFMADELNLDLPRFFIVPEVILVEVVAALLVPVVAAILPIQSVLRRPTREALAGDTAAPPVQSLLDRLLSRSSLLSRPVRLALRNTLRRKGRLARTLVALALGGAVFVAAVSLRESLYTTLDASMASQRYDVEIQLSRSYRSDQIMPLVAAVPGVSSVEALLRNSAFPVRSDGTTGEMMSVRALPVASSMFAPRMVAGRWLLPDDERAVVLSTNIFQKEPGINVGSLITLSVDGSELPWRVVGLIEELMPPINPVLVYMPLEAYTRAYGGFGRSDTLRVATAQSDAASHAVAVETLERHLQAAGYELRIIHSRSEDRAILAERFDLIGVILSVMAAIIALVGGLGLAGTMSINVIERTREIGIMRAIGASDGTVRQIIMSESITIALLAWLIGTLISLPLSYAMGYAFGIGLLNSPLIWNYNLPAVAIWLIVVIIIAIIASLLPARSAVRLTVREVLAYE